MFTPGHFDITDRDEIDTFIRHYHFGSLISKHGGALEISHLPFLKSDDQHLLCHVARANPQWQSLDGQEALLVLAGPHGYVSPSWYESAGVPTWNYMAVHITASARCFHDESRLQALVIALSDEQEADRATPWPGDFDRRMLQAIVGIELKIERLQCKYKLSQNRSRQDQANVAAGLDAAGQADLAQAMRRINGLEAQDYDLC